MPAEKIGENSLAILSIIRDRGGTDCTGTCHHRKPGEFHCHTFGNMLNLSSQGVKNRILEMLREGLLERIRLDRDGSTPLVRFTITPEGEKVLENFSPENS
jgi:DNA-binding MarR family transcriptional regulator